MNLRKGSGHELVEEVQRTLRERGFDPGSVGGVYDEGTRAAVVAFQQEHDLDPDGTVGEETLSALDLEADLPAPEFERAAFRSLLAANPNYFGNLSGVPYDPVEELVTETGYEELVCLGYDPGHERLDAVVHVKREYGYHGDVCSEGSTEYVRFYVDWENDGTWEDVGLASTDVYDIPGEKPLEYAVSHALDPDEKPCSVEQLPAVRAVLSWNHPPPAGQPNYTPVWGNVLDARIQIAPTDAPALGDLFDEFDVDPDLLSAIDPNQPVTLSPPSPSVPELLTAYQGTDVPEHRTTFTELQSLVEGPTTIDDPELGIAAQPFPDPGFDFDFDFDFDLDLDIGDLLDDLAETATNTTYEELDCLGLEDDRLAGVLTIKRPTGYLGGLCTEGSDEYVAFWEWREDTSTWEYLGTTGVAVHDIDGMPSDGLQYSVSLPVDLSHRRRPCGEGASTVRIRAIASWQTPPPTGDPFWSPTWGNRMETRVHVPPGPAVDEGERVPSMHYVGNMNVCDIDQPSGLANGVGRGVSGDDSPFGGKVYISGFISNPPEVMDGADPVEYRVLVRPHDPSLTLSENPWQPVTDPFTVRVTEQTGPTSLPTTNIKIRQRPDEDGFFEYLVDRSGWKWRSVDAPAGDILAVWDTGGKNGRWEIKVEARLPEDGTIVPAQPVDCAGGGQRRKVIVELDNVGPTADIEITGYERDGDVVPAEECETFLVGDVIHGTYQGTDVNYDDVGYFGHLRLRVRPGGPANGATVDPHRRSHTEASVPETGIEDGEWRLETEWTENGTTKRMKPCGYIVENDAWDRTIVNSTGRGRHDEEAVGFCLDESLAAEPDGGPLTVGALHVDSGADDFEALNDEWVEFENPGDEPVDLSGWIVRDEVNHTYAFPKGFVLDPGSTVRLRTGSGEDTESELYWGSKSPVWNNTGDTVLVYDGDGNLAAKEAY